MLDIHSHKVAPDWIAPPAPISTWGAGSRWLGAHHFTASTEQTCFAHPHQLCPNRPAHSQPSCRGKVGPPVL